MRARQSAEVLVIDTTADTELQAQLRDRATALAERVARGRFRAAPPHVRLSEAIEHVYERTASHSLPLLVVWAELARLGDRHATAALEDLESGADVVFGPVIDGGLYMLGLRQPLPDLLTRLDDAAGSDDLANLALTAASEMGLEIGLLRVERGVRTASDVDAALADPLTPEGIRQLLESRA